jgi:fructose-specific phosphotransferase system IIA component
MEGIINERLVELDLSNKNKDEVISHMANLLDQSGRLSDKDVYIKSVLEREEIASTAVGFGVGIPHGKSNAVKTPSVVFARSNEGVVWDDEGEVVNLVFMLAVPNETETNNHLKILAALSRKLMNETFVEMLTNSQEKVKVLNELLNVLEEVNV